MTDRKYPTTERGWRGLMAHDVPKSRRSKPARPVGTKPPICDHCGQWLHPMYDHSECSS